MTTDSNSLISDKKPKEWETPGIDNITDELIKSGGPIINRIFRELCQQIWETKVWPKSRTASLVIQIPKPGNLKICCNYRTLSLISYPTKILLRINLTMQDTLTYHDSTTCTGSRPISNLHYSDNIYRIACSSNKLQ